MVWLTQEIYWPGLFDKPQVLSRAQQCPTRVYAFSPVPKAGLETAETLLEVYDEQCRLARRGYDGLFVRVKSHLS